MIKTLIKKNILSLLLLLVMLFLIFQLSQNRYLAIAEARDKLQHNQQILAAEQLQLKQLQQLQQLQQEGPRFLQRLELFEKLIPEKSSHYEIELYIHEIAYLINLSQFQIRFNQEESFNGYQEQPLTLTLEGSYNDIIKFTKALRQGTRVFRIDTLDLYPLNNGKGTLEAYITLSTFHRN